MFGKEYMDFLEAPTPDWYVRTYFFGDSVQLSNMDKLNDTQLQNLIDAIGKEVLKRFAAINKLEPSCAKPSPIEENQLPLTSTTEKSDIMSLTRHFPTEG